MMTASELIILESASVLMEVFGDILLFGQNFVSSDSSSVLLVAHFVDLIQVSRDDTVIG